MSAADLLAGIIAREGPITFDRYMEVALYGDGVGFYETGGSAGRRGDFLTSPEVGPLFGAVVARALDRWWEEMGRPDPFTVVDAGAGPGTLALAVRAAAPVCSPAMRYHLLERSGALRALHSEHLDIAAAEAVPASGGGPWYLSAPHLPPSVPAGVLVANELLDNLPFRLLRRTRGGWAEVRISAEAGRFVEVEASAAPGDAAVAAELAPDAPEGAEIPLQLEATGWLRSALDWLERGRLVVIDYADTTASMARRGRQWLRTYKRHGRGGSPLESPGSQDVTSEVAVDQLARVRPPDLDRSQAEFLRNHGIEELVTEGRRIWKERASIGDLKALAARSRVSEAEALVDPVGLGRFRVLEWLAEPPH